MTIDVSTQPLMTDDEKRRRRIRTNAIVLGVVAFGFFLAFIIATAVNG